jgi:hypothetical protein
MKLFLTSYLKRTLKEAMPKVSCVCFKYKEKTFSNTILPTNDFRCFSPGLLCNTYHYYRHLEEQDNHQ